MRFYKSLAAITAACILSGLCGCTAIEDGVINGESTPTSAPENVPFSSSEAISESLPENTTALTPDSDQSEPIPTQTGEDANSPGSAINVAIGDIFMPIVNDNDWDYSALKTERNGYGQGTHFDDLNRPRGALRFNEEFSKYNAKAINDTEEKVISLTFDQGYENGFTGKILDTLKEKGVKATFFVVGDYAERQPELVKRMIDEGHTVGSHSWHHYSMPDLSVEEATKEIMDLHEYMLTNFGIQMDKFRPPKGEYSDLSLAVTGDLGYTTVLWSFAYADWDPDNQPDPAASLQKLIERAHPGAIYLLHSVSETNAAILGDFIDEMTAQGYSFAS